MKNYFKKFSIMFVMTLSLVVGCYVSAFANDDFEIGTNNFNNTLENSAKVGDSLKNPEKGWKRYDDTDSAISYLPEDVWGNLNPTDKIDNSLIAFYNKTGHGTGFHSKKTGNGNLGGYVTFKFKGTKLRIMSYEHPSYSSNYNIIIDGITHTFSLVGNYVQSALAFDINGLSDGIHSVKIEQGTNGVFQRLYIDGIDIDENGYLVDFNKSISLNKSTDSVQLAQTDNLTATTTPVGAEVVWSSSDESIVTVDSTGKVTGVKEGTATITAQIKGSETKATCTVTVTKGGTTTPTEPTGDGTLYIEMVDGNIKQAQDLDVADFIKWFKNRDLDDNDNPIYKIKNAKGNAEYLVHDKIVGFEVR